jgi:putative intracellular protease/amidase
MTKAVGTPPRVLFLVSGALDLAEDRARKRFSQAGMDVVIATTTRLAEYSDTEIAELACVFVPDDRAAPADFADNAEAGRVLRILHERETPIASVGRGPAFLLAAPPNSEGQWLFDGYRLASYAGDADGVSWRLDTALKAAGAVFDESRDVVVDRNLVTARNAESAEGVADSVLELMASRGDR